MTNEHVHRPTQASDSTVVQRQLHVGAANDPLEREADEIAEQVVDQRRAPPPAPPLVAMRSAAGRIRRSATAVPVIGAAGGAVDRNTESRIRAARGRGNPLPRGLGEQLEGAFGRSFGSVRLHRDRESADLNRQLSARAFTAGSDIFLGQEAPAVESLAGTRLLAHELTHVAQQDGGARRSPIRRDWLGDDADSDYSLFGGERPPDDPINLGAKGAALGITATNLGHYLERHTFKYQRLNAKTSRNAAGMFPPGTTADDVKSMLREAIGLLPDDAVIRSAATSTSVTLANGLTVNVGGLKNGKLTAFFPIAGPSYHMYSQAELVALRQLKNPPAGKKAAAKKQAAPKKAAAKKQAAPKKAAAKKQAVKKQAAPKKAAAKKQAVKKQAAPKKAAAKKQAGKKAAAKKQAARKRANRR